jgi:SNF2 family DNA or RNA helicase
LLTTISEIIDEWYEEDPTNRVIVFSQFVAYLRLCDLYLERRGIPRALYIGSMKHADRDSVIKEFTTSKKSSAPRVLLISIKAGGVGLNLTRACKVINSDLAWTQACEDQAGKLSFG